MKIKLQTIDEKIQHWSGNLKLLEGLERFQYIIEQAKLAQKVEDEYKLKHFQIQGGASKLWVVPKLESERLYLLVDSDAFITKGTAAIIADIFNGQKCSDINAVSKEDVAKLGIIEILTPQRQNGLSNMIATIQRYAGKDN